MLHTEEKRVKKKKKKTKRLKKLQIIRTRQRLQIKCFKYVQRTKKAMYEEIKASVRILPHQIENINKKMKLFQKSQKLNTCSWIETIHTVFSDREGMILVIN